MDSLLNEKKNGWEKLSDERKEEIQKFADEYMYFLNNGKTKTMYIATKRIAKMPNINLILT